MKNRDFGLGLWQIMVAWLVLGLSVAQAQGLVKGVLVDSASGSPLAFGSVQVWQVANNQLVTGAISGEDGAFSVKVPFGEYFLLIEYIGYSSYRSAPFTLSKEQPAYELPRLPLQADTETLDEVVVQGEKSTMELTLDKRIFNVGLDLGNRGGTASDILGNIPSVAVDGEGNVRLRGSDNVRILIDGKPSGLVSFKGGAGLQQLPANLIERVEVITNPSARYEAEGMAGIINIVLKKERKDGFNGSFEVVTGSPTNFGVAANMNYRKKKLNFFVNYGLAYRIQPGRGELYQEVYANDTTFFLQQSNTSDVTGFNNSITGGIDYFFNEKNILTGSYLFRRSDARRITDILYNDYVFDLNNLDWFTKRRQDEKEKEPNSEYVLTYKKTFDKKGQELIADFRYLNYWESSDQLFTQFTFRPNGEQMTDMDLVQTSLNDEYENQYLVQADYVNPIGKEGKLEVGLRASFRDMANDFVVSERNDQGQFVPLPGLDNYFIYKENISAAYMILGNKSGKFSYQAGLRGELTDIQTILRETNETNPRRYFNLFPSAHFTYDLPNEHALQLSYSYRVRRPLYNDLSPYVTFSDNRNFFAGNPNLDPEFTHVFELGHIWHFEQGTLTSSAYYRHTTDKIERIRQVDSNGFSTTLPENILSEDAFGAEFTGTYQPKQWWKMDLNLNFFRSIADGSNISEDFTANTYSWFARATSRFTLANGLDMQVRGNYEAPQLVAQGRRLSLYFLDLSVSKDLWQNKGTLSLNVLDAFNTRRARGITEGANFFTRSDFQRRVRQINLTLSYRLNQTKQASRNKRNFTNTES